MNNPNIEKNSNDLDQEIEIGEIFRILWGRKFFLALFVSSVILISIIYSITLPNIYRSQALLVPSDTKDNLSSSIQSLSGLASFAGISLPKESSSKAMQAQKVLTSRSFFTNNILPAIYLPDLLANPRWEPDANKINYDSNLFDIEKNQWVRQVSFPYKNIPSALESYAAFLNHVSVSIEKSTGFVTVTVDHVSPYIAKDWVTIMISEVNKHFRDQDQESAMKAIDYLNTQIVKTNVVEVRQVLSQLLQSQIQTSMLTESNEDYVFSYLDPAVAPDFKYGPSRLFIVILASIIGSIVGVILVFLKAYKPT